MKVETMGIEYDILEEDGKTITNLIPEVIFMNGDQNLIIRMIDPEGEIREIWEYKGSTANVKHLEKGEF